MQDERSQHTVSCPVANDRPVTYFSLQNKRRAFQVLASRLMDAKLTKEIADRRATKNSLVQSADRSEKIRTYNFAQVCCLISLLCSIHSNCDFDLRSELQTIGLT